MNQHQLHIAQAACSLAVAVMLLLFVILDMRRCWRRNMAVRQGKKGAAQSVQPSTPKDTDINVRLSFSVVMEEDKTIVNIYMSGEHFPMKKLHPADGEFPIKHKAIALSLDVNIPVPTQKGGA